MNESDAFEKLYEAQSKFYKFKKPCVGLQWKGSDICADFHCKCGAHGHIDADFVYYYKCAKCGRIYSMPGWMPLMELPPDLIEALDVSGRDGLVHEDPQVRNEE